MFVINARCANCANVKKCNGGVTTPSPIKCNAYCPVEPWNETEAEWFKRKTATAEIIDNNAKEWNFCK